MKRIKHLNPIYQSWALLAVSAIIYATTQVCAEVKPSTMFADHMVLQQGRNIPVWGSADPGEEIQVIFNQSRANTLTDSQGYWELTLPKQQASSQSAELVIYGKDDTIRIHDVLVGEVWLCSGQSNMAYRLRKALNAEEEVKAAEYPQIRHFEVERSLPETPAENPQGRWEVCTPQTAGDFTAVGYFFAREIFLKTGYPVGIINASIGGSPVEAWMSKDVLSSDPAFNRVWERRQKYIREFPEAQAAYKKALIEWRQERDEAKANGENFQGREPSAPIGPGSQRMPYTAWNGMIAPLVPYAIQGVLWYQAEDNWDRPHEYAPLFNALIGQWRHSWGRDTEGDIMPFYFVQIPNYKADEILWPPIREAQQTALQLPQTGMAVTIDIGDPGNIHPKNKQDVGRRLSLIALANTYGYTVQWRGPTFSKSEREGSSMRIYFTHAEGLRTDDRDPPAGFEIAGSNHVFKRAKARIEGESIVVSADDVSDPIAVRYAWADSPKVNLCNQDNLPAVPFRTDDWVEQPGERSSVEIQR